MALETGPALSCRNFSSRRPQSDLWILWLLVLLLVVVSTTIRRTDGFQSSTVVNSKRQPLITIYICAAISFWLLDETQLFYLAAKHVEFPLLVEYLLVYTYWLFLKPGDDLATSVVPLMASSTRITRAVRQITSSREYTPLSKQWLPRRKHGYSVQ
jgi:hypothetical protein